jgi:hypothetical protein
VEARVNRLKLWSGLLALFLSGIVIGASGAWVFLEGKTVSELAAPRPKLERFILKKLTRELNLTESQREEVERILCRTHSELIELRRHERPAKDEIIQSGMASIRTVLTPEQQEKLDALHDRMKERRHRRDQSREEQHGRNCD